MAGTPAITNILGNKKEMGEGGRKKKKPSFQLGQLLLNTPFILLLLTVRRFDFFVCLGHHNKILQIGWLKQQKFISSGSGGWADQGADKVGFILRILLLACRWPPSCSHDLCVSMRVGERHSPLGTTVWCPSYKDTNPISDQGSIL